MNEEEKNQLILEVSTILNETGTYDRITRMFEDETGFKIDHDSDVFYDIEEFIVLKLTQATL